VCNYNPTTIKIYAHKDKKKVDHFLENKLYLSIVSETGCQLYLSYEKIAPKTGDSHDQDSSCSSEEQQILSKNDPYYVLMLKNENKRL